MLKKRIPLHILRKFIQAKKEEVEKKKAKIDNFNQDFGYVKETFTI